MEFDMPKVKRPDLKRKPVNDKERIERLEFYVAKLLKNAKIIDVDADPTW